jgi:hypothetical protein
MNLSGVYTERNVVITRIMTKGILSSFSCLFIILSVLIIIENVFGTRRIRISGVKNRN